MTSTNDKYIELLAPAKNADAGITAIKCGADAVYIGVDKFGARVSASNDCNELPKLIDYAHSFGAKVYVTINTILRDSEIKEALSLIHTLYNIGADAIIVQDMGILEFDLPPIPLFASTQTHSHTAEKVKFLQDVGFQRVILARELSLDQIKEIKSKTSVDLEAFVHGALCVCYSGQCYMSYAIGGRSGNRGECAQSCRKQYSLYGSKQGLIVKDSHLLNLKDLNLGNRIKDMIEAGVSSFKIEGRLKDENYVKNTVLHYRRLIDQAIEETEYQKNSFGQVFTDFEPNISKTFNRGSTEYFINSTPDNIHRPETPKVTGELIGKVTKSQQNTIRLDKNINLNNGDGLCFFDKQGELTGTSVNKTEDGLIQLKDKLNIPIGTEIYRNYDAAFLSRIASAKIDRKIRVDIDVTQKDTSYFINARAENGVTATILLNTSAETAKNKAMAVDNLNKQLSKLGNTHFYCSDVKIDIQDIYFVPVKEINEVRRSLMETLQANIKAAYRRNEYQIMPNNTPYPESELYYNANVFNSLAEKFYSRHKATVKEYAAETGLKMTGKTVMTTKHCIKQALGFCSRKVKNTKSGDLYLKDDKNHTYSLEFDCKNCEMKIIF